MDLLRAALFRIVADDHPMTIRQVFYRAVVEGLVEKTETEYSRTIARLLLDMRRAGEIPYSWIADATRWMRKPRTYTGLADFIHTHQHAYRRSLWAESDTYVEIWCEKEALAGVLFDVTEEYDVPLMVSRGFASESYLYGAADVITDALSSEGTAEQAIIYYFGDYDPSGLKIGEAIESGLRRLCPTLVTGFDQDMLIFERVAITEETIKLFGLPTRPTKRIGNHHAHDWPDDRESVELDALPAGDLRALARVSIEQHLDRRQLEVIRTTEAAEREQLRMFGAGLERAAP